MPPMDLDTVRQYVDEAYWERGQTTGKSGYEHFGVNWWWVNRWLQCFTAVIPVKDRRVLDLGCGVGGMVAGFVTWGADAYGIDISAYAIEKSKKECDFLEGRVFEGSCHDLSRFPDSSFDLLYSNQVFEHVPEACIEPMIAEIARVLRPRGLGWFALQMPETGCRGPEDPDETHQTMFPREWWEARLRRAGFRFDRRVDRRLRGIRTGYDRYSYFDYYGWTTLVVRKQRRRVLAEGARHLAARGRALAGRLARRLGLRRSPG